MNGPVERALQRHADARRAKVFIRFFKTRLGEYGEGDRFLGITVPQQRSVARRFRDLPLAGIAKLLRSPIHEHRFTALEILVMRYEDAADDRERKKAVAFYLTHLDRANNWDLVDTSAPYILGDWIARHPGERRLLRPLVRSQKLWRQRAAIVATLALIQANRFTETCSLAKQYLGHRHDLIHKAVGWMLREVGKRDARELERFLDQYAAAMPRTMLRYAIERFPPAKRARYLRR